jgi:hypothetical protein
MNDDDLLRRAEIGRALGHDLFAITRWSMHNDWPDSVQAGYRLAKWRRV